MNALRLQPHSDLHQLLDAPIHVFRRHAGPLLKVAMPTVLVSQLPGVLSQAIQFSLTFDTSNQDPTVASMVNQIAASTIGGVLGLVGFAIAFVYRYVILHACVAVLDGEPIDLKAALRRGLQVRYVVNSVVYTILYGLAMIPSLCLLGLPSLYLFLLWSLYEAASVHEPLWGWDPLKRSAELIRRKVAGGPAAWTRSIAAWHVAFGVNYALTALASLPLMITVGLLTFRSLSAGDHSPQAMAALLGSPWLWIPWILLIAVSGSAYQIYGALLCSLMYREQRDLGEGADLRQALAEREAALG
jgi:hypothetical protein